MCILMKINHTTSLVLTIFKNDRFDEINYNSYTFRVMKVQMNKMDQTCTVVELTADSGAMLDVAIFIKLRILLLFFKP